MTSVGVYGGYPVGIMLQEDRDKLRERRNKAVRRIKILSLTQLALSVVAIAIGIATMIVASNEPMGFPVFNPAPVIAGTLMIILAGLEMFAWRTGESCSSHAETPSGLKCLMMSCYILALIWMMPCIVCAALCVLSVVRCTVMATDSIGIYCYPDRHLNITLAAIGIVICVVLAITCILNCVFFCVYARAFGFKSRGEQAMEYHTAAMMAAMQQNQQGQGHYEGQQARGQKESYGGNPGYY